MADGPIAGLRVTQSKSTAGGSAGLRFCPGHRRHATSYHGSEACHGLALPRHPTPRPLAGVPISPAPSSRPGPLSFAHRGGAALWPENTLLAFQRSIAIGADALELDLRLTADGHVVVLHDATVDRTTDGTGAIARMTLQQAQRLDAGFRHGTPDGRFPFRGAGLRIPTLEEVVDSCPGARLNVELKPDCPGLVERAIQVFDHRGLSRDIIVASECDRTIRQFRRLASGRYATAASKLEAWLFFLGVKSGTTRLIRPSYQALQVPERYFGMRVITPAFVRCAHRKDLAVHVWTVNAPDQVSRLLANGVDGVMTDRPDMLRDVLA